MKWKLGALCALMLAGTNALACYTVYDAKSRVVYRGFDTPVDLSLPLHQALRARFPAGANLVFDQSQTCTPVAMTEAARPADNIVPANTIRMERSRPASPMTSAPLLTDKVTAQTNRLPHTVVAGDVVVVPARAAARLDLPTFSVIPSDTAVASAAPAVAEPGAPDTTVLGAGPARKGNVRQQTVITEMRNPPVTIIQRGTNVQVQR